MGCSASKSKKNQEVNANNKQIQNTTTKAFVGPEIFVTLKKGSISNTYKLDKLLGEGAFGCVRMVIHKPTGIARAMKQIKKDKIIKEDEEQMFCEVNVLKQLDHPSIVKLFELYQDDKNYYLVTEYLIGGELFQRIKELNHFSEKQAADIMKQILSAIYYCHQQKIVHRDLKPENILLESEKSMNIKIIDFGTSRKIVGDQKLTVRLGTPYYIAPEVLKRKYDEKCDIWSCGVIMYILLCGYPPFNGEEKEILEKIEKGKFEFDPEEWRGISDEAKTLIQKMLTVDPTQRISAKEAYDDPWIQMNTFNQPLDKKALSNLGQFVIKGAIMEFIVTQVMTNKEKEELMKQFKSIDKNGDGQLSKEELYDGLMKVQQDELKCKETVDLIFNQVDINNSGKVDFTEFMVAASEQNKLLGRQRLEQTFKIFDTDGNGKISKEELQNIMGGGGYVDDQQWEKIMMDCDKDKDNLIDQKEFIDYLLKNIGSNN